MISILGKEKLVSSFQTRTSECLEENYFHSQTSNLTSYPLPYFDLTIVVRAHTIIVLVVVHYHIMGY